MVCATMIETARVTLGSSKYMYTSGNELIRTTSNQPVVVVIVPTSRLHLKKICKIRFRVALKRSETRKSQLCPLQNTSLNGATNIRLHPIQQSLTKSLKFAVSMSEIS